MPSARGGGLIAGEAGSSRSALKDYLPGNLDDAGLVRSIDLSEGELPTAAGIGRIHAAPICVVKEIKGVRPEFQVESFIQSECLGERKIHPVLSRTSYCSEARVSANVHRRHRELRSIELPGKGLVPMTQIRIARDQ